MSHRHEGGSAWPLILSPLSPSQSQPFHCVFLPAQFFQFLPLPPAAEHLLSSPCKPHLGFRAKRLWPWPWPCRACIPRAQLVPGCRTRHTCQRGSWELLECWEHEQTDPNAPESEKSLPSSSVREKLAHLTSAKCRDQEIPLHPAPSRCYEAKLPCCLWRYTEHLCQLGQSPPCPLQCERAQVSEAAQPNYY